MSLSLGAGAARASGFLAARFGGEQGNATTDTPVAIYFNPAGLALRRGTHLYAEGVFIFRSASYDRPVGAIDHLLGPGSTGTAGTPQQDAGVNAGHAALSNLLTSPFLGVTTDLGVPNLGLGAAFYAPFGGISTWDENAAYRGNTNYPGAVDGVQRWFSMEGTIRSIYGTVAGAYRFPDLRLSLGLGVNVVVSEINTIRARNVDGTDNVVTGTGDLQEGRSLIDVSGTTLSLGAGVIWQPVDNAWIGLSYQSQPGFGQITLEGKLTDKLGTAPLSSSDIVMEESLPDVIRIGGRLRPWPKWELRLFGEIQRWSQFKRQCLLDKATPGAKCALTPSGATDSAAGGAGILLNLERDWQDGYVLRGGGSWFIRPDVELILGMGYDTNAVPDKTLDPALMDMDKISTSVGGRFRLWNDAFTVAATYTQVFYLDRSVAARARDPMGEPITFQPPSRNPDAAGNYSQSVGLLSLALEVQF